VSGARARRSLVPSTRPGIRVIPDLNGIDVDPSPARMARALGAVAAIATRTSESPFSQVSVLDDVALVIGTNKIDHALGVRPFGCVVVPKTASAAFAWGFDWTQPTNPRPDRVAFLDVVGATMTARIIFFASASGGL
jgi:hypothetical protein